MAYPVYNSKGEQVAEIADYSLDQTTSISFVGFGSMNYMEPISENFFHLLENFASPGDRNPDKNWDPVADILQNPTIGQIWYHTYVPGPPAEVMNRLRYWDGSRWKSMASMEANDIAPVPASPGDLWYDSSTNQLMYYGSLDDPNEVADSPPTWINVNSSLRRNNPPANPAHGCMWWMLPEGQLYMYDSNSPGSAWPYNHLRSDGSKVPPGWTLIGPLSPTMDYSFFEAFKLNTKSCIKTVSENRMLGVWTSFDLDPGTPLNDNYGDFDTYSVDSSGRPVTTGVLRRGLNLNNRMGLVINGTTANTEKFNNFDSSRYFLKHLDTLPLTIDGLNSDNTRIIGDNGVRYNRMHSALYYGGNSTTTTRDTSIEDPTVDFGPVLNTALPIHFHGRALRAQHADTSRLSVWARRWETPRFTSITGHVLGICDAPDSHIDGSRDWSYSVAFSATGDAYIDARADGRFNADIAPYAARITNLEVNLTNDELRIDALQSAGANTAGRVSSLETASNAFRTEMADYLNRLNTEDARLNVHDGEITDVNQRLDTHRAELDEHQRRLDFYAPLGSNPNPPPSAITSQDEGVTLTAATASINFTGGGVSATHNGNAVTVTVPGVSLAVKDEGSVLTGAAGVSSLNFTGNGIAATTSDGANITIAVSGYPIGGITEFAGVNAPSTWLMCFGQAISRTGYPELFSLLGTTYGPGDGSTTFNLPDYRGRVGVGKDNMGGAVANRVTTAGSGLDGATLGAVGGDQFTQLHNHFMQIFSGVTLTAGNNGTAVWQRGNNPQNVNTGNTGTGQSQNIQPSIIINKIIYAGR